jgi:colicin import membrane protein
VLNELSRTGPWPGQRRLRESLAQVEAVVIGPACEEFEADYARAKDAARASLTEELARRPKAGSRKAELIRLREESARSRGARPDRKIRRDAAEEAKRAAEAEAQQKLDQERAATEKAKADAEAANQRAAETEARLKREADEKAAKDKADQEAREANKRHLATVNRKAAAAFVKGGMTEKQAQLAVTLIAKKQIPAVTITY